MSSDQLALHLTQQRMMTVLTRCTSTDRRALLFAFCCIISYFFMGVVDGNHTLYVC